MSWVNWRRLQNRYILENTPISVMQPREGLPNSKCRIGASQIPLYFERWLVREKRYRAPIVFAPLRAIARRLP